jgi:hypothetical protein
MHEKHKPYYRPLPWDGRYRLWSGFCLRGGQTTKNTKNMNKISWRLVLELVEAVVEAILRIFGGKSDKEQNKK